MKRLPLTILLTGLVMVATTSPSTALVTVGQVAGVPPTTCESPVDRVQPTVTSGGSYAAPATGTIVSWSTVAGTQTGSLKLKVYRPVAGAPNTYTVVGQDVPRSPTLNMLNTFPVNVAVQRGDLVGLNSTTGTTNCDFPVTGEIYFRSTGFSDAPTGGMVTLPRTDSSTGYRLNISAVLDPSNQLSFEAVGRNKKKGTAVLTVKVPNPGLLNTSGKGIKLAETAVDKPLAAAATIKFELKAKGKQLKKLNDKGKVRVRPTFTFTPTGGTAATSSIRVILKKK